MEYSSSVRSDSVCHDSDASGDTLFSTDVSDTHLGGVSQYDSDGGGFSTDVSETRRKRRREGNQE